MWIERWLLYVEDLRCARMEVPISEPQRGKAEGMGTGTQWRVKWKKQNVTFKWFSVLYLTRLQSNTST